MKITETHKDFGGGMKGRLTIRDDMDQVVAVILTPVQKARKYCEDNPETAQGEQFAVAVHDMAVTALKAVLAEKMEDLEAEVCDARYGSPAHVAAIDALIQFQNDNADDLLALGLRPGSVPIKPAVLLTVPAPPVLAGKNPENTALVSCQRKLAKLHEAAQGADPVLALMAIKTSRGNKYLNTCDDYRTVLLAHFAPKEA